MANASDYDSMIFNARNMKYFIISYVLRGYVLETSHYEQLIQ